MHPLPAAVLLSLFLTSLAGDSSFDPCLGRRTSEDAIIILGQKKHSSYDASHQTSLAPILRSLDAYYPAVRRADVLVWHEGDLTQADIPDKLSYEVRLCDLWLTQGAWGPPSKLNRTKRGDGWSFGYKFMIRFFAVTVWKLLDRLGYKWMIRFDDDSEIHSRIPYSIFDFMRENNKLYGFRQYSEECGYDSGEFSVFVEEYFNKHHGYRYSRHEYCNVVGRFGYYNNFFVTELAWWLSDEVQRFLVAFDESSYIFTHRHGDLIIHTAIVMNLMPPEYRYHFIDWSYHHHTFRQGKVVFGGISIGINDPLGVVTLDNYLKKYSVSNSSVQICRIEHISCPVSNASNANSTHSCVVKQTRLGGASACVPLTLNANLNASPPVRALGIRIASFAVYFSIIIACLIHLCKCTWVRREH